MKSSLSTLEDTSILYYMVMATLNASEEFLNDTNSKTLPWWLYVIHGMPYPLL